MITSIDFSKFSAPDFVVFFIGVAWAVLSLGYWYEGFEKEPKARTRSALYLILKYSPSWWRFVTWVVLGIEIFYFLFVMVLSKYFKI